MYEQQQGCRIPSGLVPYYSNGQIQLGNSMGEPMDINIRKDDGFVQDSAWDAQADAYRQFVVGHQNQHLLLLELGVGLNTPTIIRFPFERMAAQLPQATLVRVNRDHPAPYFPGIERFHAFGTFD